MILEFNLAWQGPAPRNIPDSHGTRAAPFLVAPRWLSCKLMQRAVRKYLEALEASDVDKGAALFTADGWVQSPFLGRLPARAYLAKVASATSATVLTVHDVLVSAEGHMRGVAYYLYDWRLKDGSKVAFECADVFNFDPDTGRIASVVLVYDTHLVRDVVENKYP